MSRHHSLCVLLPLLLLVPVALPAQEPGTGWSPPSREMPAMPRATEVTDAWVTSIARWFDGTREITGAPVSRLLAVGEGASGTGRVRFVRFTSGPLPVAAWSDRDGDGRCDLIVFFRGSVPAIELIDVDYDGLAEVLREYDASGTLLRETRLP